MGTSQQILSRKIELPNVLAGQRVTLDAALQDLEGNVLTPNKIIIMTPGIELVSKVTAGLTREFDIQNKTEETLTAEVIAQFDHSIQLDADQDSQLVVGPAGAQPSLAAPIANSTLSTGVFQSGIEAGTGAPQTIAHGLGTIPRAVIITPLDNGAPVPYTIVHGAHTAVDIVVTVTAAITFSAVAIA